MGHIGQVFAEPYDDLRGFIARQHVFYVATTPLIARSLTVPLTANSPMLPPG